MDVVLAAPRVDSRRDQRQGQSSSSRRTASSIDEVVLRDVRFTDQFGKAIEAKQIALAIGRADEVRAREGSSAKPSAR